MRKRLTIRVFGRVQGVFFRASARDEARGLGVVGFARNEPDGSVSLEAEGEESAVERFVIWCHEGPEGAQVERVAVAEGEPKGYTDFVIAH